MNKILELREKRAKLWDSAKAFLDSRRNEQGLLSAEDTATYEKMEADVVSLGKEIERLERQAVMDQAVNPLAVAQLGAGAAVGEDMRSAAHVLLATGDHHVRLPALDRLGGEVQGFQAGTADVVNGDRRYGVGQPAANSRLTGRVLPGSRGQHLAEDHLIHALRIDSRLLHQRLHHHAAQLNG